jgi:hypothetical protein
MVAPSVPARIVDPVIIGRHDDAFLIASRLDSNTPITGDVLVAHDGDGRWSEPMPLDQLLRFLPFDYFDGGELAAHGLQYP